MQEIIRGLRNYDCTGMGFPSASDPREMATNLYDAIWQAGVVLLPVKSVGVMGTSAPMRIRWPSGPWFPPMR